MTTQAEKDAILAANKAGLDGYIKDGYQKLLQLIREGHAPREAIKSVIDSFPQDYAEILAPAFTAILNRSIGSGDVLAMEVSGMKLSERIYKESREVTATVTKLVNDHFKGFQEARRLALRIYEGYNFNPTEALTPRSEVLPKYLRRLMVSPMLANDINLLFTRIRVSSLKTPALKASYLALLDKIEKDGSGMDALSKTLNVAYHEKMRYFANRIAQTELHRAWSDKEVDGILAEPDIEFVEWRLSGTHSGDCICVLFASQDRYGLGRGVYPKHLAPKPGAHPFCLPGDALITASGKINAVTKRWFDGDMAIITTASGKRLAATTNHPVLTPRGWIGAGLLNVGDEVVTRIEPELKTGPVIVHDKHYYVPTSIAEITDSFLSSGEVAAREVPITAEHFHGDGMAGQVAVIGAYRQLWDGSNAAINKGGIDHFFELAHSAFAQLFRGGFFDLKFETLLFSSNGIMGGLGNGLSFFGAHPGHTDNISFAAIPYLKAAFIEQLRNRFPSHPVFFRQGKAGSAAEIFINDWLRHIFGNGSSLSGAQYSSFANRAGSNLGFFESESDTFIADSILAREILEGQTGSVILDRVIHVERFSFSGHVYNLETEKGHYTANGIVTHNCRCSLIPRIDIALGTEWKEKKGADRSFLMNQPAKTAARIMGSRAKLKSVMDGKDARVVFNNMIDPFYRVRLTSDKPVTPLGVPEKPARQPRKKTTKIQPVAQYWDPKTDAGKWHEKSFANAPTFISAAIRQVGDPTEVRQSHNVKGAYANRHHGYIEMGAYDDQTIPKNQSVWRHEYGHHVDARLSGKHGGATLYLSSLPEFRQAVIADAKILAKNARIETGKIKDFYEKSRDDFLNLNSRANRDEWLDSRFRASGLDYAAFRKAMQEGAAFPDLLVGIGLQDRYRMIVDAYEIGDFQRLADLIFGGFRTRDQMIESRQSFEKGVMNNLSDLVGSATKNKVSGRQWSGFGHTDSYYRQDSFYSYTEVFANLFDFYGSNNEVAIRIIERFMPKTSEIFKRLLKNE